MSNSMFLAVLLSLSLCYSDVSGNTPDPMCNGCRYNNGVGYLAVENECFDFIQCKDNGTSYETMTCPAGTYFDADKLACDTCLNYTTVGNLTCDCSLNNATVNITRPNDTDCTNMRGVASDETLYEVLLPGNTWKQRPCAPGTVYNESICTCDHKPVQGICSDCHGCYKRLNCTTFVQCGAGGTYGVHSCPAGLHFNLNSNVCDWPSNVNCDSSTPTITLPTQACNPEVYLPFKVDATDYSPNNIYTESQNVVFFGYALFFPNSYVRMNRFSNTDFGTTLKINFQVTLGFGWIANQAVISNADCNHDGTIYIIQKSRNILEFTVFNSTGHQHTLDIDSSSVRAVGESPYLRPMSWASLLIADGVMTATVDSETQSMEFIGPIGRSQCALHLGHASGYHYFWGDIDEFKLYMCQGNLRTDTRPN